MVHGFLQRAVYWARVVAAWVIALPLFPVSGFILLGEATEQAFAFPKEGGLIDRYLGLIRWVHPDGEL